MTQDNKDKTIDLLNIGEINVPGKRGLVRVSLATFLPDSNSPLYRECAGADHTGSEKGKERAEVHPDHHIRERCQYAVQRFVHE